MRLEQGFYNIRRSLETASSVQRKVAAIIQTGSFFRERGLLKELVGLNWGVERVGQIVDIDIVGSVAVGLFMGIDCNCATEKRLNADVYDAHGQPK